MQVHLPEIVQTQVLDDVYTRMINLIVIYWPNVKESNLADDPRSLQGIAMGYFHRAAGRKRTGECNCNAF